MGGGSSSSKTTTTTNMCNHKSGYGHLAKEGTGVGELVVDERKSVIPCTFVHYDLDFDEYNIDITVDEQKCKVISGNMHVISPFIDNNTINFLTNHIPNGKMITITQNDNKIEIKYYTMHVPMTYIQGDSTYFPSVKRLNILTFDLSNYNVLPTKSLEYPTPRTTLFNEYIYEQNKNLLINTSAINKLRNDINEHINIFKTYVNETNEFKIYQRPSNSSFVNFKPYIKNYNIATYFEPQIQILENGIQKAYEDYSNSCLSNLENIKVEFVENMNLQAWKQMVKNYYTRLIVELTFEGKIEENSLQSKFDEYIRNRDIDIDECITYIYGQDFINYLANDDRYALKIFTRLTYDKVMNESN